MKALVLKASGGGGLGDSIKSVLAAALYANRSNRALYVDWSGGVYSADGLNPFGDFFELLNVQSIEELPDTDDVYPESWRGRLNRSLHFVYTEDNWSSWSRSDVIARYSFDLNRLDYPQDALVMWEFDQLQKLIPTVSIQALRDLRKQYLAIKDRAFPQLDALFEDSGSLDLGVHIRATDEFNSNKGGRKLSDYFNMLDRCGASDNSKSIFLATDNIDIQNSFLARYPHTATIEKCFSEPGKPLHLDNHSATKEEVLRSALCDVLALSKCKSLVITPGSSFSELAQLFSDNDIHVLTPSSSKLKDAANRIRTVLKI